MDTLLNRNLILQKDGFIFKTICNPKGAFAEYHVLSYFVNNPIYRVPRPVLFNAKQKTVQLPYLNGVLLITLLRQIDDLINYEQLPSDNGRQVINNLITRSIDDLTVFQSNTEVLLKGFPPNLVQVYSYQKNFCVALKTLARLSGIDLMLDSELFVEATNIGQVLESEAKVLYRDAGLYNQLTVFPKKTEPRLWLLHQFKHFEPTSISQSIYNQTFNIDFETAYQFICPADDYAFIVESPVSQPYSKTLRTRCLAIFKDLYYLAVIYRYIRVAARHTEYLILNPLLYLKRYEHYGSAQSETPLYYLDIAKEALASLHTFNPKFSYNHLHDFLTDVKKRLTLLNQVNLNS